jgi:hypothetical protein
MPTSALNRTITQLNEDLLKLDTVEQNAASDQSKADIDALGIDAATVNSLTVETSVPAGAVFTDTVYDDTSLVAAVASKENAFTKNTAFNKDFGSASDTVCEGDDARLSDARPPLAHTHVKSDITDFSDADYATAAQGAKADSALQAETVTDISFNSATKILSYTDENGTPTNIDLSAAFVDTDTIYTDAEIKTKYESNSDTNAYTDSEKTKLAGIDDNANNYSLPNATSTVAGGVKMRYDSGTDTLYLTNDGTDA